jgi:hypothetical protein
METQLREAEKDRTAEFYYLKDLVKKLASETSQSKAILGGKSIMFEDSQNQSLFDTSLIEQAPI